MASPTRTNALRAKRDRLFKDALISFSQNVGAENIIKEYMDCQRRMVIANIAGIRTQIEAATTEKEKKVFEDAMKCQVAALKTLNVDHSDSIRDVLSKMINGLFEHALFEDALMEIPVGERGRFLEFCIKKIPDSVDFIDGVILLSGYAQSGMIADWDPVDVHNFFRFGPDDVSHRKLVPFAVLVDVDYKVDKDGRIVELQMDPQGTYYNYWQEGERLDEFNPLLVAFSRLERLRSLSIGSPMQCLPLEFSNFLSNLEELEMYNCSNLLNNYFPEQLQQLPRLKKLSISCYDLKLSSSVFTWLAGPQSVPNLETLELYFSELGKADKEEADCVLDFLCNLKDNACCFRDSLRTFVLEDDSAEDAHMEGDSFEKLMTRVLPKFPNLTTIDLRYLGVESFQPIVNRIKNDINYTAAPTSIRELGFYFSRMMRAMETHPKEKAALLSFLQIFDTITTFHFRYLRGNEEDYDPDIKFALQANHAGRRIVQVSDDEHRSPIPVSLWPTVLKRAYEKSDRIYPRESKYRGTKDATGLFYLLREIGPSLVGSTEDTGTSDIVEDNGEY